MEHKYAACGPIIENCDTVTLDLYLQGVHWEQKVFSDGQQSLFIYSPPDELLTQLRDGCAAEIERRASAKVISPVEIVEGALHPDGSSHWQDDPGKWENCGPCGTWGDRDYGPNARTNTPGVI